MTRLRPLNSPQSWDGKIAAGEEVRLIGEFPDPETVGTRPRSVPCPRITDDFEELDGEGVA